MNEEQLTALFEVAKANVIKLLAENDTIDYSSYPGIYIDFQLEGIIDDTDVIITTHFSKDPTDNFVAEEPTIR